MLTTSKKENSVNEDQQNKLCHRFKYDFRALLQEADKSLFTKNLDMVHSILRMAISELKIVTSRMKVQVASDIATILQEADKALLAKKPIVAHSCIRLAITEMKT